MTEYFRQELVFDLVVFQAILLAIVLSNIWITRRARRHPLPREYPMVSILVPARDEERNIEDCVQSLLAQDYPCYEILVLDDQSSDGTRDILNRLAVSHPGLRVLDGEPLSGNVVGKNWACGQLARQARGELLLFTDADTRHHPQMLRSVVTALAGEQADMLTGFPRQIVHSWGERLLVPFFSWVLSSFIPLVLAYRLRLPLLSNAVGQLMLFRRNAYHAIGGHESVSTSMVDDIILARRIKAAGLRWRMVHIADRISCRMYRSSREAVDGFTKNLFAVFDYRLLPFLLAFSWLMVMFWEPLVALLFVLTGEAGRSFPSSLAACLALSSLLWLIHMINIKLPVGLAFLYPLIILANVVVALRSIVFSLGGYSEWKQRKITRNRWKWL